MRKKIFLITLLAFITFSMVYGQEEEDKTLLLPIGDEKYKNQTMEIHSGKIYSAGEAKPVSFLNMIKKMKKSRFVYVGESHNSLPIHDIQLKIIKGLYEQNKNMAIGMEMFSVCSQEILNQWSLGILTKEEFIRKIEWYTGWSYNYGFYEKILDFAKEKRIPVYALNVPREIIRKVRLKGWESLSEREKQLVPKPELENEDHQVLLKAMFGGGEQHPTQMKTKSMEMAYKGLFQAQAAWDEAMALHAVQAVEGKDTRLVVLAGSGHLLYNLGINLRVYKRLPLPFSTVICVPVPDNKESVRVSRSIANYIWAIPEEKRPAFPTIGLSLKKFEGLENLVIGRKPLTGVTRGAGFEKGDIILFVDGKPFDNINELRMYLSRFKWDEEVTFRVLRDAREVEITVKFQEQKSESES